MNLELGGRGCVVIGGSRGIGRAIALGLAAEGANVAVCGRTEASLDEARDLASSTGPGAPSRSGAGGQR